jgi:hypothetical protein
MQTAILACQTMRDELELSLRELSIDYPVIYLESGLHNSPDLLRQKVQEQVNALDADIILMVFGCCGQGLVGINSGKATLVIPRIGDCVTLLLGSAEARKRFPDETHTYFITKGWLDPDGNVMWSYQEWVDRYGDRKALKIVKKMLSNYSRFTIIDTGAYSLDSIIPKVEDFCETLGMNYDVAPGSLRLLHLLLTGPWQSEFIIIKPGQETVLSDFN